ncbi:hypothetical protein EXIGLDRAFT_498671 [Exidia glandulosa HHB12029]|uniref:Uncharacterized protein n=1 Tax=Exidia glandulosa HHB12029 TaxID=1314781 RepID=A0A165JFK4_EXIGL|nr:hypothetical protein EXIGLDRAFT_498671 [Exidia glandulosa HHB12029]
MSVCVTFVARSMGHKWYKKETALSNLDAGSLSRYPYEIFWFRDNTVLGDLKV